MEKQVKAKANEFLGKLTHGSARFFPVFAIISYIVGVLSVALAINLFDSVYIMILFTQITFWICVVFIYFWFARYKPIKKRILHILQADGVLDLENLANEVKNLKNRKSPYFGDKYFFHAKRGLLLSYNEIVWLYNKKTTTQLRGVTISEDIQLMLATSYGKTLSVKLTQKDAALISSKNQNLMVGYTEQNIRNYQEILKQYRNQRDNHKLFISNDSASRDINTKSEATDIFSKKHDFLRYANMKRKGEVLPEGVQVSLDTTPNGLPFSVAIVSGDCMEIHECDASGNSIYRTYGGYKVPDLKTEIKTQEVPDVNNKNLEAVIEKYHDAIKQNADENTKAALLFQMLQMVAVAHVIVPFTYKISDSDLEQFMTAKKGSTISTKDEMRLKPDIVVDADGNQRFPIFTSEEQMPTDYSANMSKMIMSFLDCYGMVDNYNNVDTIVINPFSSAILLPPALIDMIKSSSAMTGLKQKETDNPNIYIEYETGTGWFTYVLRVDGIALFASENYAVIPRSFSEPIKTHDLLNKRTLTTHKNPAYENITIVPGLKLEFPIYAEEDAAPVARMERTYLEGGFSYSDAYYVYDEKNANPVISVDTKAGKPIEQKLSEWLPCNDVLASIYPDESFVYDSRSLTEKRYIVSVSEQHLQWLHHIFNAFILGTLV